LSVFQGFGLVSKNPVLKNITDYLIEEASAEEEELLGQSADQEEGQLGEDSATIERDDSLIKVRTSRTILTCQCSLRNEKNFSLSLDDKIFSCAD